MSGLKLVERDELDGAEYVIRVSLFSRDHGDSARFAREVEAAVDGPCYITDFPLNVLPHHRESRLDVIDLHPPCLGKAEALRFLAEEHGIPPERVVAVGDATNDVPMFEAAGLSVCMSTGMEEARRVARRVIGSNEADSIAELVEELFLAPHGSAAGR
ncbi:MAG: HAD family phosphatase [Planctomycetes bacterium]|nr:HAD family phosphatase [Planctomycetota bacterium]